MSLQIGTDKAGAVDILSCRGEIDLSSAPQLRAALEPVFEAAQPQLLMDLSGVSFMDSTGIGIIVNALNRLREGNGKCAFCGAGPRVHRILQIAGLINALPLYETRAEALESLEALQTSNSLQESAAPASHHADHQLSHHPMPKGESES